MPFHDYTEEETRRFTIAPRPLVDDRPTLIDWFEPPRYHDEPLDKWMPWRPSREWIFSSDAVIVISFDPPPSGPLKLGSPKP